VALPPLALTMRLRALALVLVLALALALVPPPLTRPSATPCASSQCPRPSHSWARS